MSVLQIAQASASSCFRGVKPRTKPLAAESTQSCQSDRRGRTGVVRSDLAGTHDRRGISRRHCLDGKSSHSTHSVPQLIVVGDISFGRSEDADASGTVDARQWQHSDTRRWSSLDREQSADIAVYSHRGNTARRLESHVCRVGPYSDQVSDTTRRHGGEC